MVLNGQREYGEVQFYFLMFATDSPEEMPTAHALVSLYSRPIQTLLTESSNTLWACKYGGFHSLRVVPLSTIVACVSVQPLPPLPDDPEGLLFVLEKSGLEEIQLTGFEESLENESGAGEECEEL
jgi:hypothetical protein